MSEIKDIISSIIKFRDERNWKQFHNSKDLALAISIEASELLELFLWKDEEGADKDLLKEELADVLTYCLLLAEKHDLNVAQIIREKLLINDKKYPVEKARGKADKYTDL